MLTRLNLADIKVGKLYRFNNSKKCYFILSCIFNEKFFIAKLLDIKDLQIYEPYNFDEINIRYWSKC
jgi:hypothetical protein